MSDIKLTDLTIEELNQAMQKKKSRSILNAILVGFLIGIVIYSIVKNTLGLVTLIPLFLAYKIINNSKTNDKDLDAELQSRNLK
jgi:riboflavin transporter FmnP